VTNWHNVGDTIQSFVTAAGVIVGGVWAYFKFVKDRVYRPRVNLDIAPRLLDSEDGRRLLVCRFDLENTSASKISIRHEGTAAIISSGTLGPQALDETKWSPLEESAVLDIFTKHDWLESTETISDEVAVPVSADASCIYRIELHLNITDPWPLRNGHITISTFRIVTSARVLPETQSTTQTRTED
jgi:hypothetical protein